MLSDEKYMKRCLELAVLGKGHTYPNPMVGAVLVNSGKIIGEGWHRAAGQPHAEVLAIRDAESANSGSLKDATLYVNLEPCDHHGRTPPCTELILEKKIGRVVTGSSDPNPLVSGRGINRLISAGVEVKSGVLEKESEKLNERFFTFH